MKWATAILSLIVLGLAGFGIAVQASISNVQGETLVGNPHHFLLQQTTYFLIALLCCIIVAVVDPEFWTKKEIIVLLCIAILISLVSVHIPGFGKSTKGSARWISMKGVSIQPSEFVKLLAILLMAWWQSRPGCLNSSFKQGALIPIIVLGIIALGFLSQPDFGSVVMLGAVNLTIMLTAGVRIRHIMPFVAIALIGLSILIAHDPVRRARVTSVLRLNSDKTSQTTDGDSYQLTQSLSAIASGRLYGVGFGKSVFKQYYLPENHTDFVFAMISEELGFIASIACIVLFLAFMWCGLMIAIRAPSPFTRLLAFGMTMHLSMSAGVNLGVVTGLLPTKGLALPFLSYGGSSLVSSLIAVGFLLATGWRCPVRQHGRKRNYTDNIERKVWVS
jgi:cell division protein FtsW